MIRNETEYQQAVERVVAEKQRLIEHCNSWAEQGFSADQVAKLREPLESFHMQLAEEVKAYEGLKRGQIRDFENLVGLGQTLIGLRIARGMTQRQLAEQLGVAESSVSRDERNEYHGITVERANRVLEALGVRLVSHVEVEPLRPMGGQVREPEPA